MQTWADYSRRYLAAPEQSDIALMHLLCAVGLRGAEWMDIPLCIRTIDQWAEGVKYYTGKLERHFTKQPHKYHRSMDFFRAKSLITILQRDFGVKYNPDKMDDFVPFEPADSFLFGIIQGNGGTCGTMPVLYVAIGRRLGYPVKLVEAKGPKARHLFVRWEDPVNPLLGTRFNIEAAGHGMSCPSDDYYRQGKYTIDRKTERAGEFLQTKTPTQELSCFLAQRHYHLEKQGNLRQAANIIANSAAGSQE